MEKGRLKKAAYMAETTLTQIAEDFGVDVNTVWRWSAGKNDPSDDTKKALAKRLNTSVAYLMGEDTEPHPRNANNTVTEELRVEEKISFEKQNPLNVAPFAAALDLVREHAKNTSHEDRLVIASILRRALDELEVSEEEQLAERKFDGLAG